MTVRYVASTGSNTSPYDTWAKACTTFKTVTDLMGAGDITYVRNETHAISATTTYTIAGTVASPGWIISTASTAEPPTTIDVGFVLDASGTSGVSINLTGKVNLESMGIKSGGSTGAGNVTIASAVNSVIYANNCTFELANSNAASILEPGGTNGYLSEVVTTNCTFKTGSNASQSVKHTGRWRSINDTFSWTTSFQPTNYFTAYGMQAIIEGGDLSTITNTLVTPGNAYNSEWYFIRCKLGALSAVVATQTQCQLDVFVHDSSSGNTHYEFAHYNYWGNTTISTAVYLTGTDGASYDAANDKHSWKVTSVNGTYAAPYVSPWISVYNEATAAVTPRLEILRYDGTNTDYNDNEVWGEWSIKETATSTRATIVNDRCAVLTSLNGSPAAQAAGVGTASWTMSGSTNPRSQKLEPTASQTPAVIGHIRARVAICGTNKTVYVNPKILGV